MILIKEPTNMTELAALHNASGNMSPRFLRPGDPPMYHAFFINSLKEMWPWRCMGCKFFPENAGKPHHGKRCLHPDMTDKYDIKKKCCTVKDCGFSEERNAKETLVGHRHTCTGPSAKDLTDMLAIGMACSCGCKSYELTIRTKDDVFSKFNADEREYTLLFKEKKSTYIARCTDCKKKGQSTISLLHAIEDAAYSSIGGGGALKRHFRSRRVYIAKYGSTEE